MENQKIASVIDNYRRSRPIASLLACFRC